jgi:hypothetical protein
MMGRLAKIGFLFGAYVLLSGQAVEPTFDELCTSIIGDQTEYMEECVNSETEAYFYVMSWFDQNGLLTPEGDIDSLQLIQAQTDPMRALYETPASTAAFCVETTADWIGMSECILITDQSSLYGGTDPSLGGPDMGPEFFGEPGLN